MHLKYIIVQEGVYVTLVLLEASRHDHKYLFKIKQYQIGIIIKYNDNIYILISRENKIVNEKWKPITYFTWPCGQVHVSGS